MGEMRYSYEILVRNLKERDHLEGLSTVGSSVIKMGLKYTGWKYVDWIHLAENRDEGQSLVNTVMNLWVS
jgi:hypothetical protein